MENVSWIMCVYLCLNWYAYVIGITHAQKKSSKNRRRYFQGHFAVCVSVIAATFVSTENILITLFCFILSFSFWYKGAYFITKKNINEPQAHWFYHSIQDPSYFRFGGFMRTLMFIISLAILTTYITHITTC